MTDMAPETTRRDRPERHMAFGCWYSSTPGLHHLRLQLFQAADFASGWLQSTRPDIDWLALGWQSNPHFGPVHIMSFALIRGGFRVISVA
ncbi:hypothetical protein [Halovulum marinum]|uniref:hypothetical protein n=1 Tax=Halovulum marinum TaxID=2662447 RepID=UPI001F367EEF